MASCINGNASNLIDQYGFKVVPEFLTDITPEWCEKALQKGLTISKQTKGSIDLLSHFTFVKCEIKSTLPKSLELKPNH